MNKKNTSRENLNLFFSAFLILAYIICGYFFVKYAYTLQETMQAVVLAVVFVVFGLLLFYATRVGDGVPVKRFSIITLIVMVLPALYAVLASIIAVLPLHAIFQESPMLTYMAGVALGYGIPYTFVSGFETVAPEAEEAVETEEAVEGTAEAEEEVTEEVEEAVEEADEEVVEGIDFENYQEAEDAQEATVEAEETEDNKEETAVTEE